MASLCVSPIYGQKFCAKVTVLRVTVTQEVERIAQRPKGWWSKFCSITRVKFPCTNAGEWPEGLFGADW